MSDLTPETLAELKRLEQAATAIPWDRDHFVVFFRASGYEAPETITNEMRQGAVNLSLIESLRNAAPALIAAAEECERLRGLLRHCQWSSRMYDCTQDEMIGYCPECHGCEPNHAPDCRLAAAIKGTIGQSKDIDNDH